MSKRPLSAASALLLEQLPPELQCLIVMASGLDIFAWQCTGHHFHDLIATHNLFQRMGEFRWFHCENHSSEYYSYATLCGPTSNSNLHGGLPIGQRLVALQPRFLCLCQDFVPSTRVLAQLAPSLLALCVMDDVCDADHSPLSLTAALPLLTNLRSLELIGHPGAELEHLGRALTGLQHLEHLCYAWDRLDSAFTMDGESRYSFLRHLTALRSLDLCGDHRVTYKHVKRLTRLEALSMRNAEIDARLNRLSHLTALYSLDVPSDPGYRPVPALALAQLEPRIRFYEDHDSMVPTLRLDLADDCNGSYYWPITKRPDIIDDDDSDSDIDATI